MNEKVREDGAARSQAVLMAIGIDWEGRRNVLAVELANRDGTSSWKSLLVDLRNRGLRGVQLAISDDHPGLNGQSIWMLLSCNEDEPQSTLPPGVRSRALRFSRARSSAKLL